jgi:hypothetical protein
LRESFIEFLFSGLEYLRPVSSLTSRDLILEELSALAGYFRAIALNLAFGRQARPSHGRHCILIVVALDQSGGRRRLLWARRENLRECLATSFRILALLNDPQNTPPK